MLEALILIGVPSGIVWIVFNVLEDMRASKAAAVDQAWREVLNDPHYTERRQYEERKRVVNDARLYHR